MNGFTKKSVGTMTLGERLQKLRSDRRISLGEISRATRIQLKYLECLETGEYEKLPADVYVRGFLRSYADYFGISEQALLRLYEKEKGIRKNLKKDATPKLTPKKPVNVSSFVFTPKKIAITFSILVILVGFFFLYREIGSFASTPRLLILSPQNNTEVAGNSVFVEGLTDTDASLYLNGHQILVGDDGKFRENLVLQPGANVIEVKAVNKFQKEADDSITIRSDQGETAPGSSDRADTDDSQALKDDGLEMELWADPGPVWLSVEADGTQVFSGTILSGAVQKISAKDKIVISSGNGKATHVKFKGADMGVLSSETGAVRGVTFTRDTSQMPNPAPVDESTKADQKTDDKSSKDKKKE